MHWHYQNLNEKSEGGCGSILRNGRAWFHFKHPNSINFEWGFRPKWTLGVGCSLGGMSDNYVTLFANVFGAYLYIMLTIPIFRRLWVWAESREGCETGVELAYEESLQLRIDLCSRSISWHSKDPKWVQGWRIDFADLLFGRTKYHSTEYKTDEILIPMPEGCYKAKAKLTLDTWKRPRLPWISQRRYGASADIPGGIPCAGKGENSWDCGDDGTYGLSTNGKSFEELVGKIITTCLTSRRKYGQASFLQGKDPLKIVNKDVEYVNFSTTEIAKTDPTGSC